MIGVHDLGKGTERKCKIKIKIVEVIGRSLKSDKAPFPVESIRLLTFLRWFLNVGLNNVVS